MERVQPGERPRRGVWIGVAAGCIGTLWILLRLLSWIEIWITERAMADGLGGGACSGAGLLLYLGTSWLPTLFMSGTGVALGIASVARQGRRWWCIAALLLNVGLLAWQLLELAGVMPHLRHPCLR